MLLFALHILSLAEVGQSLAHHFVECGLIEGAHGSYVGIDDISLSGCVAYVSGHWVLEMLVCFLILHVLKVAHASLHALLVHGDSLLQHMESSRDDVKLTHNFLKSLSELFSAATLAVFMLDVIVIHVTSYSRFLGAGLSWLFGGCHLGGRSTSSRWLLRGGCRLRVVSSLGAKVFDKLLVSFIKIGLPYHDH